MRKTQKKRKDGARCSERVRDAAGRRQRGGQARGGDLKIPKGNCRFLQIGFLQVCSARLAPCRAGAADLRAPPLPPTTPWRRACGNSVRFLVDFGLFLCILNVFECICGVFWCVLVYVGVFLVYSDVFLVYFSLF